MEHASIRLDGRRLEFRRIAWEQHAGAPAVVFLHEGLGSVGLWRDFPDALCARTGLRGLVYSRYGNGFSDVLARPRDVDYMHTEARDVLPRMLDTFEIDRAVLFGQSDGASIALIFAANAPERCAALVLEAPHVFVEPVSVQSIDAIGRTYRTTDLRARMARYHRDVDRTFFGWNDIWLAPAFADWNITGVLPSIRTPILCIQGRDDEYGTLEQIDAITRGAAGMVDRLILDDCGHAPHRDRPDAVEREAAAWIARVLSTTDDPDRLQPRGRHREKP